MKYFTCFCLVILNPFQSRLTCIHFWHQTPLWSTYVYLPFCISWVPVRAEDVSFLGTKLCFGAIDDWVNCEHYCILALQVCQQREVDRLGNTFSLCLLLCKCDGVWSVFRWYPEVSFVSMASPISSLLLRTSSFTRSAGAFWYYSAHNINVLSLEIGQVWQFTNHSKKLKIIFVA